MRKTTSKGKEAKASSENFFERDVLIERLSGYITDLKEATTKRELQQAINHMRMNINGDIATQGLQDQIEEFLNGFEEALQ